MTPTHAAAESPCPAAGLLFDLPEAARAASLTAAARTTAAPRLQRAERDQVVLRPLALDQLLPDDHDARAVWAFVVGLDLACLYDAIRAVEGHVGRPPIDPKILLALWLYATLRGVGSARQLEELCEQHHAYQWLCGDVSVNYHTLADFRTAHGDLLDRLLTESVARLRVVGLVDMERVAQDGLRVRASAGSNSFRRRPTLERCRREAAEQVQALRAELQADPGASSRRQQQARQRAATERAQRVEQALAQMPLAEAHKKAKGKAAATARVSTTDPEARVMRMADGGFRPAYNVQLATDTQTQVIVGVDVSNNGSDQGQLAPMVEQVTERHEQTPKAVLADGGFVAHDDVVTLERQGCAVYMPVPEPQTGKDGRPTQRRDDRPEVVAWQERMATAEAQTIYRERAASIECVNAQMRNHGVRQFQVRGLAKVRVLMLWYALAHNLRRLLALQALLAPSE
jgi:transposase